MSRKCVGAQKNEIPCQKLVTCSGLYPTRLLTSIKTKIQPAGKINWPLDEVENAIYWSQDASYLIKLECCGDDPVLTLLQTEVEQSHTSDCFHLLLGI